MMIDRGFEIFLVDAIDSCTMDIYGASALAASKGENI
jgi:hypothetical protein